MSDLNAFLNPASPVERREVVISKRFRREDGSPAPFVIRPITQGENDELIRQSTHPTKVNGQTVRTLNQTEYGHRVVVAATLEPNFSSEELCAAYGTLDPLEVPGKMLLVGEYGKLSREILALSGMDDDPEEQAKN